MLILALSSAGFVAAVAGTAWIQSLQIGEPQFSELDLEIKPYDTEHCDAEFPLFIRVGNNSKRTVKRTFMTLEARRPDRSTNLISPSDRSLNDDGIMKPGEGWGSCWSVPELTGLYESESPKSLVWSVRATSVEWAD